ncbi:MAG: hypothetical protein AW06_001425 [Candidatus Accumulibacter cognatus]|uniref:Uncharacterized protein n=1 Tax=Candidatus Accumulibacter cognatus TaxID=2954383 RepID=A0A080MAF1_9PROT|nr:MAG: hypothetical protein AW06_001425 [Candidatus Accumulibacter cognatus]
MQARQQVLRHVFVPRRAPLGFSQALLHPLRRQGAVNDVDDFDEEGGSAGGGIEDLDEGFVRRDRALLVWPVGERRQF